MKMLRLKIFEKYEKLKYKKLQTSWCVLQTNWCNIFKLQTLSNKDASSICQRLLRGASNT